MTTLLDARTSQNASFANSIFIPITPLNSPQLFGRNTLDLSGANGQIRTQIEGVISLQLNLLPVATTVTISIVRGLTINDLIVYTLSTSLDIALTGPQIIPFVASDFNVPIASSVVYSAFVTVNLGTAVRVGPESVNFTAYFG